MEKPKLKGLFHVSDTRGGDDYTMGRVVMLESSGEILAANLGKVILDRKHFSFLVQVILRHLQRSCWLCGGQSFGYLDISE